MLFLTRRVALEVKVCLPDLPHGGRVTCCDVMPGWRGETGTPDGLISLFILGYVVTTSSLIQSRLHQIAASHFLAWNWPVLTLENYSACNLRFMRFSESPRQHERICCMTRRKKNIEKKVFASLHESLTVLNTDIATTKTKTRFAIFSTKKGFNIWCSR